MGRSRSPTTLPAGAKEYLMLNSLMVPLDGSKFSEGSLPLATEVARATGARLHLAHIHVPYEPDSLLGSTSFQFEGVNMAEYDSHHREEEVEYMATLVRRLSAELEGVDARVIEGSRVVAGIAAHATEVGADMVFIASHGDPGVSHFWLGSVADELIRRTTVPLLVTGPRDGARAAFPTIRHILVPLDGSELAESVLAPAVELARATGARMTLVRVVPLVTVLGPRVLPLVQHELEPELARAKTYLDDVAAELRDEGLDVATRAAFGQAPPLTIAQMADASDADVIALATHGYGGLKRTLFGSVANRLLRATSRPVLIVRPAAVA
jgi:nucleotide-binding universal stress UspA family protein